MVYKLDKLNAYKGADVYNEYKKYLEIKDKEKIIMQIKSDLLDIYYNISLLELDMLSNNIYDCCCLIVNEVPKQEILKYLVEKNSKYYEKLSEKDKKKLIVEPNIKIFKDLTKKYTQILKNDIEL